MDRNNGNNGIGNVTEVVENRESGLWFAVLDLKWGYFQVELAEECRNLTTILSFDGKYRFKRMPMGLNASGDVFNIRTDALISGIPEAQKIVDDILLVGRNKQELLKRMEMVFKNARRMNVSISKEKLQIGKES